METIDDEHAEWDKYDITWPQEQWMWQRPQSFAEAVPETPVRPEIAHPSLLNNPDNGRKWLLEEKNIQLAFESTGPDAVHANEENVRFILGHTADWKLLDKCPIIQKQLTLWAAIVIADTEGEEIVEPASIHAEPGRCAWRVSFKPRDARKYAVHVRTLWWNEKEVEPAYDAFDSDKWRRGTCHVGDQLKLRSGWQWSGPGAQLFTLGPGMNMVKPQCQDLCTYDDRCAYFDFKAYTVGNGVKPFVLNTVHFVKGTFVEECLLYGAHSKQIAGNCSGAGPKKDRGAWQYLGGWNVFRRGIKDEVVHSHSHIVGSPLALPAAVDAASVVQKSLVKKKLAPCSGREQGRWRIVEGTSRKGGGELVSYQPYDCEMHSPSKEHVLGCFQKRNIRSITLAGDSLMQEQFVGIQHLIGNGTNNTKNKIEGRYGEITATRPDGVTVRVKLVSGAPRGLNFAEIAKDDVFISNLNAQHVIWHDTMATVESEIRKVAEGFRTHPSKQTRILFSGVYPHSLRQSYIFPSRMERHNEVAERSLTPFGFRTLDAYNVTKLVGNLTQDGMHLYENAFVALTPLLVTMICGGD